MNRFYQRYLVKPNSKIKIAELDPGEMMPGFTDKDKVLELLTVNNRQLARLQNDLYSENRQSLLIILQALDAGGKDGTINNVFAAMNPQGCRVQSFKTPTALEQAHDFLWRVHPVVPRTGEVVIFNRSYYEAVLVEKVHNFASPKEIEFRYRAINNFEELLSFHNTRIVKFFLNISKDEQLRRFVRRLKRPEKHWKISANDYPERQYWDNYIEAFEAAITRTSTADSPWFVIPGNCKWYRNLVVSQILLETMTSMNIHPPKPSVNLKETRRLAAIELSRQRAEAKQRKAEAKAKK
ncbi:MAG: polyphosphate kinase 2 family protein [Lentisphaeria bacterium]|nr:polyphosphate kinase 2 family protein [Lentisphaeria bacterium]